MNFKNVLNILTLLVAGGLGEPSQQTNSSSVESNVDVVIGKYQGLARSESNDSEFVDELNKTFTHSKSGITKSRREISDHFPKLNYSILFVTMNGTATSMPNKSKSVEQSSLEDVMFFLAGEKSSKKPIFIEKRLETSETRFKMHPPIKSPHAVLLLANTSTLRTPMVCSGTLVAERYVLTAASCLKSMQIVSDIVILAGGRSINELNREIDHIQKRTSSKYLCHPNYTSVDGRVINDIAIVKAQSKFSLSAFVNVLKLSRKPWSHQGFVNCSTTGFGKVQLFQDDTRDYMRKTYSLSVKKPCKCFEGKNTSSWMYADPSGPGGTCAGDVGSGLVCDGDLVAVTSQPLLVYDLDSCDLRQPPDYYTECGSHYMVPIFNNIHPFLNWVERYTKPKQNLKSGAARKCPTVEQDIHFVPLYLSAYVILS